MITKVQSVPTTKENCTESTFSSSFSSSMTGTIVASISLQCSIVDRLFEGSAHIGIVHALNKFNGG